MENVIVVLYKKYKKRKMSNYKNEQSYTWGVRRTRFNNIDFIHKLG